LALLLTAAACQRAAPIPPKPAVPGPPAIPDTQPAVNDSLFVGQTAFAAPLAAETDFTPSLATVRADGANSGVVDGPAPLGQAPVTGSDEVPLLAPLLGDANGDLIAGCRVSLDPGLVKNCLAAVNPATLSVEARWVPPEQDLNLASAVIEGGQRILIGTAQGQLFEVEPPNGGDSTFRVDRQIDLGAHLGAGQGLQAVVADSDGNLWFASGGPDKGPTATDTTIGYVTPNGQVVLTTLADQEVDGRLAVDQEDVYVATSPSTSPSTSPDGTAPPAPAGRIFDLTANNGQVQTAWQETYDAGDSVKPGATTEVSGSGVVLLGSQYLAVTDNAATEDDLLVFRRGPLPEAGGHGAATTTPSTGVGATTTSTSVTPEATTPLVPADPRLVCSVGLFTPGASAVTTTPIGYSSGDINSVIVTNGYDTPPPLASPYDDGPGNNMDPMPGGLTRVDVLAGGSGCRTQWTTPVRFKTAPVLSTATGLIYGYTQDPARAATGTYVWYFEAVDYGTGRVIWEQRAGAGSTKNDDGDATIDGADGVLYQTVPLGLVWMRDVTQQP